MQNDIRKLELVNQISIKDFIGLNGSEGVFWLMKRIITDQEERIKKLELEIERMYLKGQLTDTE
jgi:hypothetical protein